MHGSRPSDLDVAASRREHERWQAAGPSGGHGGAEGSPRPVVSESWRRCRAAGVDPDHPALHVDVDEGTLRDMRRGSPLTEAMPLLRSMLLDSSDDPHVLAVSDPAGRLLHVEGDTSVRTSMDRLGFTPGALWDEAHAGTNAPGTALALDAPVRIMSGEHWATPVHGWSCSAAPVHDPRDGTLLGAVDVSGGPEAASSYALTLVRAAVAAVEDRLASRLGARTASSTPPGADVATAWLQVLGVEQPLLHVGGRSHVLTPRHAEVLLVLADQRAGVGGDALAEHLSAGLLSPVTVRAEVSRLRTVLRRLLGVEAVGTRPYRLLVPLRSDADDVAAALARGAHRRALDLYGGPVLPASEAPVATRARQQLQGRLRGSVLQAGSTDSLWRWAATQGRDDLEVWQRLLRELPYGSPRRAQAKAHLALLAADG